MIEFLEIFLFGKGNVQMADPLSAMAVGSLVTGGIQLFSGIFGGGAAKRKEKAARREKQALQRKLTSLENSRQPITDPYAGVTNLSGLAADLSSQMSNSMANLSVATQAAEMEIEQADISLSSKKGVSASIEKQEAQNEKLRAQGEQDLQARQMQEQQRLQGIQISEGQRVQGARAQGAAFTFGAKEDREMQQLDRVSTQLSGAEARQMQAGSDRTGALTGMIGGLASTFGSAVAGGAFKV